MFSKIESAPYNAVRLMYESGCAFSSTVELYVVDGAIFLLLVTIFL